MSAVGHPRSINSKRIRIPDENGGAGVGAALVENEEKSVGLQVPQA